MMIYGLALLLLVAGSFVYQDTQWSTFSTLSLYILSIATLNLLVFVVARQSVSGISMKMIGLQGTSCAIRLAGTSWLNGYVPVDSTGDGLYQVLDLSIVMMSFFIFYHGQFGWYRWTYEPAQDTFPAFAAFQVCVLLAIFFHPALNRRFLFDTMWMVSLNFDCISAWPQVWMMSKNPGQTMAFTSHFVFLLFMSRAMNFMFWWRSFPELGNGARYDWIGNMVVFTIFMSLVLVADFIFYYVRALGKCALSGEDFDMSTHFTAIV